MAIAVVQSVVKDDGVTGNVTVTLPAPPTPGNLLVAAYYNRGGSAGATRPTPLGGGWTNHPSAALVQGSQGIAMFYRRAVAGDPAAFVCNPNDGGAVHSKCILVEISGVGAVHAAAAFDVRAGFSGNATMIGGAVTPPASLGAIVFGGATLSEGDFPQGERAITDATAGFTYVDGAVAGLRRLNPPGNPGENPQTFWSYRILGTTDGVTSYTPGGTVPAGADSGSANGLALAFVLAAGGIPTGFVGPHGQVW